MVCMTQGGWRCNPKRGKMYGNSSSQWSPLLRFHTDRRTNPLATPADVFLQQDDLPLEGSTETRPLNSRLISAGHKIIRRPLSLCRRIFYWQ